MAMCVSLPPIGGVIVAACAALGCVHARADERLHECFSTAETRDHIAHRKLVEPFALMQSAGRETDGDPIAARLCHIGDLFIYEISLLRPDGRIVRILVDAVSGKPHASAKER
jgi:uncharacterized membrane protein YkoI